MRLVARQRLERLAELGNLLKGVSQLDERGFLKGTADDVKGIPAGFYKVPQSTPLIAPGRLLPWSSGIEPQLPCHNACSDRLTGCGSFRTPWREF